MWIFLNDRFVPSEQALISVLDHGFLYGDGVYETLRAYRGRIFLVSQHLARLHRSAEHIGLTNPFGIDEWTRLLEEALKRNDLGGGQAASDAYIRITLSRGEGEIGLDPSLCKRPTVVILTKPLSPYPATLYEHGVRVAVVSVRRNLASAVPPRIKSLNFLNNILAKREASTTGAFDAVMLNHEGMLAECTASNLFFVHEGRLHTPSLDCGILDGVTRGVVMQLSREHSISVEEGAYPPFRLYEAEECFLTNTSMEIMPVSEVDGTKVGPGRPGVLTVRLRGLFHTYLPRYLA
jgi:branched-chain amino acid aminotransferase